MASFNLNETLYYNLELSNRVYVAFLDSKKAFDTEWRKDLMYELTQLGVKGKLWQIIDDCHIETHSAIGVNQHQSRFFEVFEGVRQGGVLSALLRDVIYLRNPCTLEVQNRIMEREKIFEQIQGACQSLISENEEFVFISVNTQTKQSKCMASQIGVDFLNQQLVVDSVDTCFLQLFKNLVKVQYSADVETVTEQDSVTKILQDKKLDSQYSSAEKHDDRSYRDTKHESNIFNEIEANKLEGSETQTNDKVLDKEDPIVKSNEKTAPKKCGRPKKEESARKTNMRQSKQESVQSKSQTSKTSVMRSRSGRRVSMPKWLQEDYREVMVKTEPVEETSEGVTGSRSSAVVDRRYPQKREKSASNSLDTKNDKEKTVKNDNSGSDEKKNLKSQVDVSDYFHEPPSKKAIKRKIQEISLEDTSIEGEPKVVRVDNSGETLPTDVNVDNESKVTSEVTEESSILNDDDKFLDDDEEEDVLKEEDVDVDGDEICKEEEEDGDENQTKLLCHWTCAVCQVKRSKCFLVRRHMRRMHDVSSEDLTPCNKCKTVYANEICGCSSELKRFNCDVCGAEFKSHKSLLNHEEIHKNETEVPCHICSKKFRSIRHVKMHVYHTHKRRNGKALTTKIDPAMCDICGKWFKFKCNALRHREIHFDEKRFKCSVCNMKFRHSSSLKRHMTSHQEKLDKMYVCEQCGRSFKLKQTLVQHHRVHVKQSFLKCEYCFKEFRTYKGKKYHILKYHPEKANNFGWKSYDCETCGKQMSSQTEHDEHQKTHDETRLYSCTVCSSRWETIAQMKAHLKSHSHIPFRYRCKVCNISFKAASKVRLHMLKEGHLKKCHAKGLDQSADLSNKDIIEVLEYDFGRIFGSGEDLEREMEQSQFETSVDICQEIQPEMQEIPEEIKVIRLEQNDYDGVAAQVKILNEEGVEVLYDQINLPEEEITVEGEQVIYQVEIDGQNTIVYDSSLSSDGQNTIICDTLTSQAVESILKLQTQG